MSICPLVGATYVIDEEMDKKRFTVVSNEAMPQLSAGNLFPSRNKKKETCFSTTSSVIKDQHSNLSVSNFIILLTKQFDFISY